MKPLFTIHAGEYLFGNEVESRFPNLRIWIPSKDDGIDFLLTDRENKKTLSIQVKYSKDFNWTHGKQNLKPLTKTAGWYSLNREKIENSMADFWVLVNYDGFRRIADYIFIKPHDLLNKFNSLGRSGKRIESYVWVTNSVKCYETRNLKKGELNALVSGKSNDEKRDLTAYLEKWDVIQKHFK